jgi:hypothetical protein
MHPIHYACPREPLGGHHSLQPGVAFDYSITDVFRGLKMAVLIGLIIISLSTIVRQRREGSRRRADQHRLEAELAATRAREDAAAIERATLDAALRATRDAAETQRMALQQLSSELGDRLLQQQTDAFHATTAALERRASSESEAIRAAYEAATAERNERLRAE